MTIAVLSSLGGLGLFLLGMGLMTDGLKALAGRSLRHVLSRFTRSPSSGAAAGAVVTAAIQSSSATTVTAVGLVGAGLLTFSQALGIIFGANIGTTVTGWLVALFGFKISLGVIAMPMAFVGVLIRTFSSGRTRATGLAIAGFALLFIGLGILQDGMSQFRGVVTPDSFPGDTFGGRLQLVGIGVVITLVTQSSSAGVATAMTALHAGTIGLGQAAAMIIGMDVGTTITAVFATIGGSTAVRRTGYAHMIYNVMTGVMAFALLSLYLRAVAPVAGEGNAEFVLVGFHTLFNGLGVLLVLPVAGPFARLIERLIPANEPPLTRQLDSRLLREPELGLDAVTGTVAELSALAIALLRSVLTGETRGQLDKTLAPMDAAVRESRRFLSQIHADEGTKTRLHGRVANLMHALDHLGRIIVRFERFDHSAALHHGDIAEAARELDSLAERLDRGIRSPGGSRGDVEGEATWQALSARHEEYRRTVLLAAASGDVAGDDALECLDAMRWLVRMTHHAWRLAHHLDAARAPYRAVTTDVASRSGEAVAPPERP